MSNNPTNPSSAAKRIRRMLDPSYPLCREDVIWVLHYVQKKVALEDPSLLDLSKPRLLKNFSSYCEAALLLHGSRNHFHAQNGDIRTCLIEAMHGLPELAEALTPTLPRTVEALRPIADSRMNPPTEDGIHPAAKEQD